jgi:hypothetical protein
VLFPYTGEVWPLIVSALSPSLQAGVALGWNWPAPPLSPPCLACPLVEVPLPWADTGVGSSPKWDSAGQWHQLVTHTERQHQAILPFCLGIPAHTGRKMNAFTQAGSTLDLSQTLLLSFPFLTILTQLWTLVSPTFVYSMVMRVWVVKCNCHQPVLPLSQKISSKLHYLLLGALSLSNTVWGCLEHNQGLDTAKQFKER